MEICDAVITTPRQRNKPDHSQTGWGGGGSLADDGLDLQPSRLGIEGADAAQRLISATPKLLGVVDAAFEEIRALHEAFGAPGDYGYDTREGKALWRIYQFQRQLLDALIAAGVERLPGKVQS